MSDYKLGNNNDRLITSNKSDDSGYDSGEEKSFRIESESKSMHDGLLV